MAWILSKEGVDPVKVSGGLQEAFVRLFYRMHVAIGLKIVPLSGKR